MKTKLNTSLFTIISLAFVLGAGMLTTSCEKKPETLGDKIKDGLDIRPNEKLKDAGEDLGDAVEDAADAVKDAVK